jgi:ParB family chromosome partitioning protein
MTSAKKSLAALGSASDLLKDISPANGVKTRAKIADLIDHPYNRKNHDDDVIRQIAAEIEADGDVREPIGVKPHPTMPGKFLIFSGHGRKKAYIVAGRDDAPIYINENYDDFDLVRLNIRKSDQDPSDTANFLKTKLAEGFNKSQIAEKLGVSNSWITQHSNLLNLPAPLEKLFESGRCKDVTLITELLKLHKLDPERAETFINDESVELTRSTVSSYVTYVKQQHNNTNGTDAGEESGSADSDTGEGQNDDTKVGNTPTQPKPEKPDDILKIKNL